MTLEQIYTDGLLMRHDWSRIEDGRPLTAETEYVIRALCVREAMRHTTRAQFLEVCDLVARLDALEDAARRIEALGICRR